MWLQSAGRGDARGGAQVRAWVRERAGFDAAFRLTWYPGRYDAAFRSIFAVGDVTQYVPDCEVRRRWLRTSAFKMGGQRAGNNRALESGACVVRGAMVHGMMLQCLSLLC